jgi:PAS domain S-box-containing protein
VDLALRLQPGTQHVVVVGGTAAFDQQIEAVVRQQLRPYEGQLDVSYLTDIDMPGLLQRLKHLPDHTIILLTSFSQDAAGTRFISGSQAASLVVGAANAPVFSLYDVFLNHGEVGGRVSSLLRDGEMAGRMALRALNGEKTQDISVATSPPVDLFDWRALQRWGLKESNLPPGSTVLNRQPSLWESFRRYVIGGMTLILAEALLISGLLWQRTRRKAAETKLAIANKQLEADIAYRKRAEATLRESEERFRLVANTAPVMIWMSGPDKLCTYLNHEWLEYTGQSLSEEMGNGWGVGLHPEDLAPCLGTYEQAFDRREPFQMQYRLRRHDGEYRWVIDHGVPRFNADGSFAGYIGSCIDVTEQKLAEEALSTVNQKLIQAHEEERTEIARELHDDINQRLALLAIGLERLRHNPRSSKAEITKDIAEAVKQVQDLGSDVQALSHHLHSPKLDLLGLAAAAAGFCREVSNRQEVEIDFHSENIPKDLPEDASLCLFRVLQEAIQNAIKHSGSRHFEVSLSGGLSEVELTVRDFGIGFDPQEAMKGSGLGLTTIRERLKLVNGNLSIDSQPQHGTTIQARVPLTGMKSVGAAG